MSGLPKKLRGPYAKMFDGVWEFAVACRNDGRVSPTATLALILSCYLCMFKRLPDDDEWKRDMIVEAVNNALEVHKECTRETPNE